MITYDEFAKVELRVATVRTAERVEGSEKLIRLEVDAADRDEQGEPKLRQVVAGIGKAYEPEQLVGKQIVVVANLQPRSLMGVESQGMLLAASDESGPAVLTPDREVPLGSGIK